MPTTYVNITSQTLGSNTASITFSSIPQTYTDLLLKVSARNDKANSEYNIRFNGDTATNYSLTNLLGDGATASSARIANRSSGLGYTNRSTYTANTFSNGEIYIPSYTAAQTKPFAVFDTQENNAATSVIGTVAEQWRNSAAITSITLLANDFFVTGSTFYLYGIKNS